MALPLEKNYTFNYTTEDLYLLQDIYIDQMLDDKKQDEFYGTEKTIDSPAVKNFVYWLMEEDRTQLLKI